MDISPRWSTTTKFIVALAILAIVAFLLLRFQALIAPVIMVFMTAYLLNPVVNALIHRLRLPRTVAVLLVYLFLILLVLGVISGAGLLIQQQFSGVLSVALAFINNIPEGIRSLSTGPVSVGPFTFDPTTTDFALLQNALLPSARDGIARITEWMTGAATGVASFLGWTVFVFTVSFYLLLDLDGAEKSLLGIVPEEYRRDAGRLFAELGPIWNAFLRGQVILSLIGGLAVGLTMGLLGVQYALILGLIAALMSFVPILGYHVTIGSAILVALFQSSNWLGFSPTIFIIVVAVAAWALQEIKNSILVPRVMQSQLKVPAAVLIVGVLIGASLLGFTGLLLSAPIIATAGLFGKYVYAKMFNLSPWPDQEATPTRSDDPPAATVLPREVRRKTVPRQVRTRGRRARTAISIPPATRPTE
jgi:predicted PurR-regulated permease PerM